MKMTQEEMKNPEFKKGDIVSAKIFTDGSFGLVQLNQDLTNRFTSVDGFWYIKRDCAVRDEFLIVFIEDTRHATPEEIEEYETALTFHEHGRKPFEVKDGDLLENVFGKYIAHEHSFSKEYFTIGGNTLLKTVEEYNERLENK